VVGGAGGSLAGQIQFVASYGFARLGAFEFLIGVVEGFAGGLDLVGGLFALFGAFGDGFVVSGFELTCGKGERGDLFDGLFRGGLGFRRQLGFHVGVGGEGGGEGLAFFRDGGGLIDDTLSGF